MSEESAEGPLQWLLLIGGMVTMMILIDLLDGYLWLKELITDD